MNSDLSKAQKFAEDRFPTSSGAVIEAFLSGLTSERADNAKHAYELYRTLKIVNRHLASLHAQYIVRLALETFEATPLGQEILAYKTKV